ncbi:MAG: diguanylate cyclase domain-containing protein, partial [Solirubrobacteraceae bacterium]
MNSTAEQLEAPPAPAGDRPLRVLVVENGPGDGQPTARALLARHDGGRYALDWRARYADGLAAIRERRHDVYLIAGWIAGASGVELVREAFSERRFAPVIMLGSDLDDEAALALGVTDQIKAHELALPVLERAIRHAVRHHGALTELARSEERYSLAIRAANDGIWDWDLIDGTFYVSPRWCAIMGRAQADAARDREPATWFDVVHPGDLPRLRAAIDAHLAGRTAHLLIEHRMRHADGGWRWVVARGLASRDERAAPVRMAGSLSDVTDRRMAQRRLAHDALHDTLTGMPNRTLFADRVAQALRRARRDPSAACAVLFLDVDRFKLVNDSLSHAVGDRLLIALAECVATALRPGDTVARLGGDEFAVLLEEVVDADDALLVCERIMRSLTLPFHIDGHELFASVSIGIALGAEGLEAGELIGGADIAMFDAKRRGRGRCAIFDEGMRRRAVHRLARENELRQVVEGSLLGIHYQP